MKTLLATMLALGLGACSANTTSHVSALTGQSCEPNASYMPHAHGNGAGGNGQCQGTGNGDNCDDLHSGKIDCIGDGNSGQGDDKKHNCMFPQPGCDDMGCCDGDMVDPPAGGGDDDEGTCDGGTHGDPGGGGGGGGDDAGSGPVLQ